MHYVVSDVGRALYMLVDSFIRCTSRHEDRVKAVFRFRNGRDRRIGISRIKVKGTEMQWKMEEGRSVSWGLGSEEEDEADAGLRLGLGLGLDPAGTPTWPTSVGMSQPDDVPLSSSASSSSAPSSLASDPPSPPVSDKDEDVQSPLTRSVSRHVVPLPESRGRPSCPSRLGFFESLIPRRLSSPECLVVAGTALSLPAIQVIASDPVEVIFFPVPSFL